MTITELITILLQYPGNTEIDTYGYPVTPTSIRMQTGNRLYLNIPPDIQAKQDGSERDEKEDFNAS